LLLPKKNVRVKVIIFGQNQNQSSIPKIFQSLTTIMGDSSEEQRGRGPVARMCPVMQLTGSTVQPLSCGIHSAKNPFLVDNLMFVVYN